MSNSLGPVEITCDAPPYLVVQACRHIQLRSPGDVRWLRMSAFRQWQDRRQQGPAWLAWKRICKSSGRPDYTCTCGAPLPVLSEFAFTFNTGDQVCYLLGQCRRCQTIFWEEP